MSLFFDFFGPSNLQEEAKRIMSLSLARTFISNSAIESNRVNEIYKLFKHQRICLNFGNSTCTLKLSLSGNFIVDEIYNIVEFTNNKADLAVLIERKLNNLTYSYKLTFKRKEIILYNRNEGWFLLLENPSF